MKGLPRVSDPNLIVGCQTFDDAGVYKLTPDLALVQTVDFFTPIVDDPYHFGRIAAANSLSDVYAMGGKPLTVMNLVCFPADDLPKTILQEILKGGLEKTNEAGAILVGGHSVNDKEIKYGLSVTGLVHPDRVVTNRGARAGDKIILTKPIGIGVIATAIKGQIADPDTIKLLIETTSALNDKAAEAMLKYGAHSCTDITGFGLGGHLLEMARAGQVEITIYTDDIPFIDKAIDYARLGVIPAGTYAIKHFCEQSTVILPGTKVELVDLIFDPQTSGGLAFALEVYQADDCIKALKEAGVKGSAVIGEVTDPSRSGKLVIRKNRR